MVKISGWIFMLVGIFIVMTVFFITPDLWIFNYIGGLFIAYGCIKVGAKAIWQTVKKPKKETHRKQEPSSHPRPGHVHLPHRTHQHVQNIFCKKCGKRMGVHDNFCGYCGMRLK